MNRVVSLPCNAEASETPRLAAERGRTGDKDAGPRRAALCQICCSLSIHPYPGRAIMSVIQNADQLQHQLLNSAPVHCSA